MNVVNLQVTSCNVIRNGVVHRVFCVFKASDNIIIYHIFMYFHSP